MAANFGLPTLLGMDHQDGPNWTGLNHLALITGDMDATVRFYPGVLGARLVATIGTPAFCQARRW